VVIANPKWVKAVKGNKDDTKNPKRIGDLFRIGPVKSSFIPAKVGVDMAQFGSSTRLCCWAGLTPGNNESAGKKKSVRISRAGAYLKPALVQVAHATVKDKQDPYYALKNMSTSPNAGERSGPLLLSPG